MIEFKITDHDEEDSAEFSGSRLTTLSTPTMMGNFTKLSTLSPMGFLFNLKARSLQTQMRA